MYYFKCDSGHYCKHSKYVSKLLLSNSVCSKCGAVLQSLKALPENINQKPQYALISKDAYAQQEKQSISHLFKVSTIPIPSQQVSQHSQASSSQPFFLAPPSIPFQTPVTNFGNSMFNPSVHTQAMEVGEELSFKEKVEINNSIDESLNLEHVFHTQIIESQSQEQMYQPLVTKGYLFLARDGEFKAYKKNTSSYAADETVPEPGIKKGGEYIKDKTLRVLLGRLEGDKEKAAFTPGATTYPDYLVYLDNRIYAIELKTPRTPKFSDYLSVNFLRTPFRYGRTIQEELTLRRKILPGDVDQVMLFDLRNTSSGDPIRDLYNYVVHTNERRSWFTSNVTRYMFYGDGLIDFKPVTLDELESAVKSAKDDERAKFSKGTQPSIFKFINKK